MIDHYNNILSFSQRSVNRCYSLIQEKWMHLEQTRPRIIWRSVDVNRRTDWSVRDR